MKKLNNLAVLKSMKHSAVLNYALPGLTSWCIGGNPNDTDSTHGLVRMFEADRSTQELIIPHSHRYNFSALVLEGKVTNTVFRRAQSVKDYSNLKSDPYWVSFLTPGAAENQEIRPGKYNREEGYGPVSFFADSQNYVAGDWYNVHYRDIHSIAFSRGCKVVMFEGPDVTERTTILEPYANGKRVPTFTVAPWMFERA